MSGVTTVTALDLIQDALEALGVYGPGDSISAADQARTLTLLNEMLDEWAGQTINVYELDSLTLGVLAGIKTYTIGPSGNVQLTAQRPDRIAYGPGAASITTTPLSGPGVTSPVNVVSAVEFQALQAYNPPTGLTDTLYYQAAYPWGILNLLPVPNVYGNLTFSAWQRLSGFLEQATTATLAVGVEDAIRSNLAVYAKPYFTSSQLDPDVAVAAQKSKDFLRYQSITSRAAMNRFTLLTNPQKAG